MAEHGGLVNFKHSRVYESEKAIKRQAREQLLAKAKEKHEKEERRKERKKRTGEDVWMLPAVNERLATEEESLKPKKHKKEKKKHKKHKKEKKRKRDSSSGSEASDGEMQWVESSSAAHSADSTLRPAPAPSVPGQAETQTMAVEEPAKRDDWMMASFDLVPTVSQKEIKQQRKDEREKEKEKNKSLSLDAPGQHARELNPYWKDGGTGLPEEAPSSKLKDAPKRTVGADWMRRQYKRAKEQAEEEGRSLEEIVEHRWGSLEKFQQMLADAEEREREQRSSQDGERDRGQRSSSDRERWRKPASADRRGHGDRHRYDRHEKERSHEKDEERRKSPEGDRRTPSHKDYSRDRDNYTRREPRRQDSEQSRNREDRDSRDNRRHDRDTFREKRSSHYSSSKFSGLFKKPTEDQKDTSSFSTWSKRASPERKDRDEGVPGWKKKAFKKPGEDSATSTESMAASATERPTTSAPSIPRAGSSSSSSSTSAPSWKKKELQQPEKAREPESSSSDSSSDSEDEAPTGRDRSPSPPVRILSEEEMNSLGAKLVKAELMGNEELAAKIKMQLEQARKAKEAQPKVPSRQQGRPSVRRGEEEEVILTRTDNTGRSWPLPEVQDSAGKGRRRKTKKIETHDKSGTRQRYFEDDDQHDLTSMAQQERRTTAADQNAMYARMAAKFSGKPDFTLDDMFESSVANKGTTKKAEERERQVAMAEHRRQASRLDKCRFCFENPEVPKHLIIAIGKKVYLTLPSLKSLTEGHCLLVPMQHVNSGTTMDEEVWAEVQAFRRCLVQMFQADDDQDCVFMETAMRLNQFRHTAIECVPLPRELGDMAPIYFKKAIMEADVEWAQNKRLIDLKGRDVRKAVPKGLPYFSVDFGMQSGFAHVIEDEQIFPHYFGREILGGMLDLEPRFFRKPPKESFEDQRKKVLKFAEQWKPHDWTKNIGKEV
ncbi:CWF19L2 [Branchiostoma lanceolatum]|uniref:CWF19-like protein 2 n=1 Tax=Branchiostoma lanceolatum TaxID=7740 RepID=A0A8K0EVX2_BRALA|nr:CWF19L2 [Branchiostoma lanceolatum]